MKKKFMLMALSMLFAPVSFAQPVLVDTLRGAQELSGLGDFFGDHVVADSDWLIVGAPREDVDLDGSGAIEIPGAEVDTGAAYIYKRTSTGLVFHQKLVGEGNSDIVFGDRFGAGVTLQGSWLFIGAANDNNFPGYVDPNPDPDLGPFAFAGQVYVFRYNAAADLWEGPVQKLVSDAPESAGAFGGRTDSKSVATFVTIKKTRDPRILLIGESAGNGPKFGQLHVFRNNQDVWERVQIAASPSGTDTTFGGSVVPAGKFALVTESAFSFPLDTPRVHAYRINDDGIVKTQNMLIPIQTLDSPGGLADRDMCGTLVFGKGISAGNGTVAIADPCDSTAAGAVHVYSVGKGNNNPLSFVQTLPNPNPAPFTFYGSNFTYGQQTISTDGERILVGTSQILAPDRDVDLYTRDNGTFTLATSIATPESGDLFNGTLYGQSVNLIGDGQMSISQMGYSGQGGGRVFVYELHP